MSNNDIVWKNRIVKYGSENPENLLANEWNWRIHSEKQEEALEQALSDVGWVQDVIVNLRNSDEWGEHRGKKTVTDGHARVKLAVKNREVSIPVKYVDLSPVEEKKVLVSFDRITMMADEDSQVLLDLIKSVEEEDEAGIPTIDDDSVIRITKAAKNADIESIEFPEYDESVANEVKFLECPECGYKWAK